MGDKGSEIAMGTVPKGTRTESSAKISFINIFMTTAIKLASRPILLRFGIEASHCYNNGVVGVS